MKKRLLTTFLLCIIGIYIFGQSPQSMNYQAILRDAQGQILANKDVEIGIAILQGSSEGVEVFSENHSVTTNDFGLVNLQIGSVNTSGMENIDWSSGPYFVQISLDGTVMGTSQLLSVPYALHANTVEDDKVNDADSDPTNELQDISLSGTQLSITQGSTVDLSLFQDGTGTDNQRLYLDNNVLRISRGNSVSLPYLSAEQDGDPANELQVLSISNDTISISDGNKIKLPAETDPVFTAWDKSTGIEITESQITDLNHFTNTDETDPVYVADSASLKNTIASNQQAIIDTAAQIRADMFTTELDPVFSSWDKSTGIKITESQITDLNHFTNVDETDQIYSSDSSYLKTGTRSWNSSLAKKITEADTTYWGRVETDPYYAADSSYIKTGTRSWNSSISKSITESDTAYWNDKTYIADTDGDTKITAEQSSDEDIIRMNVAGNEAFTADDTGFDFVLPTNDDSSNLKVKKSNGTVVFGVDGSGLMNGDGSGLSNVKSLANSTGGNQLCQITKNYAYYQNIRSVTLETPSSGKCFVMASGYIRWESKGWDLLLSSILRNANPNESWDDENEFFRYLNLSTDYNCTDSSDQYVGFAQHRCFNVGAGTQTFTLWGNKYTSSAKVRVDDVNITVLFFPTAGTGTGTLKSSQLDAEEEQLAAEPFTSIPRRPDGGELRERIDAMINEKQKIEEVPDDELIILQKSVDELKAENEKLKQEKSETDKRLSEIEKRIKLLMNSDKLNH